VEETNVTSVLQSPWSRPVCLAVRMDDLRLLCFGDSFTAGVGDQRGQGWVGRTVEAAFAAGRPLTAYALGVRRETSVEVAVRWRFEAMARRSADADCRVVFAVGANDTTVEHGRQRVTPERSCTALGAMLDQAAAIDLPAAVAGPPPVGDAAQRARAIALSDAFGELCAARAVPFWPVARALDPSRLWLEEQAAGDGAHPGARGYDLLARTLLDGGLLAWLLEPLPSLTPGA
jgi:acyl-CoA thioesterase-1